LIRKEKEMKKTILTLIAACLGLGTILYVLDLGKITSNLGRVEINLYPAAGFFLLGLFIAWRTVFQRNITE
jgi:hypothetical protein